MVTKVAMVREPGYPVGVTAPMYLNCPCGAKPATDGSADVACACGQRYSGTGWVMSNPAVQTALAELLGAVAQVTPGPWHVERHATRYPDLFTYDIIAPRGWADPTTGETVRCGVAAGLDCAADARLIAAAPELVAAVAELAAYLGELVEDIGDDTGPAAVIVAEARALLARIDG